MMKSRDFETLEGTYIRPTIQEFESIASSEKRRIYSVAGELETLGCLTKAAEAKQEAVALEGKYAQAYFLRGYIAVERKDYGAGLKNVGKAVELSPINPHYLSEMGFLVSLSKDYERAIVLYERAITGAELLFGDDKIADEKRRAMRGKGYCLIELGRLDEATKLYVECLRIFPEDTAARNELRYIEKIRSNTGIFQGRK